VVRALIFGSFCSVRADHASAAGDGREPFAFGYAWQVVLCSSRSSQLATQANPLARGMPAAEASGRDRRVINSSGLKSGEFGRNIGGKSEVPNQREVWYEWDKWDRWGLFGGSGAVSECLSFLRCCGSQTRATVDVHFAEVPRPGGVGSSFSLRN
jgi:hypothetical protein